MPVDKEQVTEHQRAQDEFTSIAQSVPDDSYVCFTDGLEQKDGPCGTGFVVYEGSKVVKKGHKSLGSVITTLVNFQGYTSA